MYMHYGMSREEFWFGEPWAAKDYRVAHNYSIEQKNQEYFVLSNYIGEHIAITLANAFAAKGTPPQEYRAKPIRLTPMSEEEIREEELKKAQELRDNLTNWANRFKRSKNTEDAENARD